jgi:opacity protein-like surface antigen
MSLLLRASILVAALVVSLGSSNAQLADFTGSSRSGQLGPPDSTPALAEPALDQGEFPSAPSADPSTGASRSSGQYDNRVSNRSFSRFSFEIGGGGNAPVGDSSQYITWGGQFIMGAGYRFNPTFSTLVEFQSLYNKLPGAIIAQTGAEGGHAVIWSFTLAPVIDLTPRHRTNLYLTGGGGFYRKITNFTNPQEVLYCSYFICDIYTENVVIGHFSSNQFGWNIGGGAAYRFKGDMRLYAEVRYLDVLSPAVTTEPNGLGQVSVGAGTVLIPFTFGIRW